jgi:hypothetical protein
LIGTSGCSKESPYYELTGSTAERVTKISALLQKPLTQPNKANDIPLDKILNAHFFQERIGEAGDLGPSDYCSFYALNVAPENIPLWEKSLTLLPDYDSPKSGSYLSPAIAKTWWATPQEFQTLSFYDAFPITSNHGWVGVAKTGHIYIYGCTS